MIDVNSKSGITNRQCYLIGSCDIAGPIGVLTPCIMCRPDRLTRNPVSGGFMSSCRTAFSLYYRAIPDHQPVSVSSRLAVYRLSHGMPESRLHCSGHSFVPKTDSSMQGRSQKLHVGGGPGARGLILLLSVCRLLRSYLAPLPTSLTK